MDRNLLQTLRIGDTVRIHLNHNGYRGGKDPKGQPFDIVIAGFSGTGRAYKHDDDGQYHESRLVKWYWADMPVELQPADSVRDDIRGLDSCHEDYITDIVARGPYTSSVYSRNALYHAETEAFLDHQKVENYRKAKGEDTNSFGRRRPYTTATGYRFDVYNETYKRNIGPGQYNGHVFKLAEALIARRPALTVSGMLDPDRFYAAWNGAGQPGRAGPYQETEYSPFMRDRDRKRIDPSPFKALINRKAFTRWVERNAHRFVMTKVTILKNMIQAAIDEEEYIRKSMEEDYEREFGHRHNVPVSDTHDEDEDEDRSIFYAGGEDDEGYY